MDVSNSFTRGLISSGNSLLGIINNQSVFLSDDSGETYEILNDGLTSTKLYDIACSENFGLYVMSYTSSTWKYSFDQNLWQEIPNDIDDRSYCLEIGNNGELFLGSEYNIYKSTDQCVTWQEMNNGIHFPGISNQIGISSIIEYKNYLFALSLHWDLFRSADHGAHWFKINNGIYFWQYYCKIATDSSYNTLYVSSDMGLFRSIDDGDNWTRILDVSSSKGLVLASDNEIYYSANGYKVLHSTDGGTSWKEETEGLEDELTGFAQTQNREIFASSRGGGVYKYLPETTDNEEGFSNIPDEYKLEQNYPNPFNPTTKIKYQIHEPCMVELIVYDLLGREIKKLVNEYKPAGSYDIVFDGSNLSSGVYFYNLKSGNYIETKKMVLLR